ncbi:MAG: S46 family peptidase, partial [Bacteroidales bacterium]|nr:S46 family peptidase [Bacteroidales bacterium]
KLKVYEKKQRLEEDFTNWLNADQSRKDKYGEALSYLAEAYKKRGDFQVANIYQREAITRGSEILGLADRFTVLRDSLNNKNADQENINQIIEEIRGRLNNYFKDYNAPTDQKLLAAVLDMYSKNVHEYQQPDYFKKIASKYKGNFTTYAEDLFAKSNFVNREKVDALLDNLSAKAIEKDPAFKIVAAFKDFYEPTIEDPMIEANSLLDKGNRLFVAGLREMNPDKKFYPDANFTMRLTYGSVLDYYPEDAVHFNYYTTLKGVMEKEDPDNWEFVVPEKLKELYQNKDYGKYGEGDVMKLCFLTDHDITGGNSGSPVINGNGELIGLAFDGNWEAMSGDIAFEPELQRTINVDIRYVLFIIDKFAGAKRLVDEMTIVAAKRPIPENEIIEKTEEEIPVEN